MQKRGVLMLWCVKGGRHGEYEQLMLDKGVVVIGWKDLGDLRQFKSKADLQAEYARLFPNASAARRGNHVGQLWAYVYEMKSEDLVVVRLKTTAAVAVGQVAGTYEYRAELASPHAHTTKWLQTDVPPDRFGQDLLFSFGAQKTIARVRRNDAETRVKAIASGKPDPGIAVAAKGPAPQQQAPSEEDEADLEERDLAELARDNIRTYLSRRFTGHELARLVEAILKAQGYVTYKSPPGADGGVDILAGAGPMGFGSPRMVVQVKSGDSPVGSGVLRELRGTMQTRNADQGLLVSWAGFKTATEQEARQSFFNVRLWDQDELITALLEHYERLDETVRVDLPLKQVWVLAAPHEGEEPT